METTRLPRPRREAPPLAWADDHSRDEPIRQPWGLAVGYSAVLLACMLVWALVVAVVIWVTQQGDPATDLITSDQINHSGG